MKDAIPIIFIVLLNLKASAQINTQNLLKYSKSYYLSLRDFSLNVETKFKNAIIIDTIVLKETFYINTSQNIRFIKNEKSGLAIINNDAYNVYLNTNSFDQLKGKGQSIYKREYSQFPFTESNSFFFKTNQFLLKKPKVTETDSTYLLSTPEKIIEFRKEDYSIKRIKEVIYDKLNKGYQSKELFFGVINKFGPTEDDEITNLLDIINDSSNLTKQDINDASPKSIDYEVLLNKLEHLINADSIDIRNKVVFLDFFYQGCYPCVKSYPYVNQLYENKVNDFIVIGVDRLLADSATIDKYIKKYNLRYPIVVGANAADLSEYFKLSGFPVFIAISPDGKILLHEDGFSKASFRRIEKQLRKK